VIKDNKSMVKMLHTIGKEAETSQGNITKRHNKNSEILKLKAQIGL